jgi:acyl-CoA thioesterase II
VADLAADTELRATGSGQFSATLSADWDMWGPNGGYLAALALRAVGATTALARPASLSCQYLAVGELGEVQVAVRSLRGGRRAELLRVSVTQGERALVEAQVWATAESGEPPEREWLAPPALPDPDGLPSAAQLVASAGGTPLVLWRNYEVRPVEWADRAPDRPAAEPRVRVWLRFHGGAARPADPWLDAARLVVGADIAQFPAVSRGFAAADLTFIAPSLDLYVAFHRAALDEEWLILEGVGTGVCGRVAGARAQLWTRSGRLVATATQQMLLTTPRRP